MFDSRCVRQNQRMRELQKRLGNSVIIDAKLYNFKLKFIANRRLKSGRNESTGWNISIRSLIRKISRRNIEILAWERSHGRGSF